MTLKNTILISVGTYLALDFVFWALGWMIWPVVWLGMGYGSVKIASWVLRKEGGFEELDLTDKIMVTLMGPIFGILAFVDGGYKFLSWPNWLSTIRNPFVWPQKEVDESLNQQ